MVLEVLVLQHIKVDQKLAFSQEPSSKPNSFLMQFYFIFCLLWSSVRKAWWQQGFCPCSWSVSVIFTLSLHRHKPLTVSALSRLIQKTSRIFPKFPCNHIGLLSEKKPKLPQSVWQVRHSWCTGQGTQVTAFLAVQSQAWQPVDPSQAPPSPEALQGGGRSLCSLQEFISVTSLKWRESGVWWPPHTEMLEQLRGGGKWFFLPKIWFSHFSFGLFHYVKFSLQEAVQAFHFLQRADSKSSSIQEKMKASLGILGLMQKHAGVVFGDKRDLGNPGSYFSPFSLPKTKWKTMPELNRLSAANPTFPERPRSLQGLLLKCEAATAQHTGGEADPSLVQTADKIHPLMPLTIFNAFF